jgi:hypothetical protein
MARGAAARRRAGRRNLGILYLAIGVAVIGAVGGWWAYSMATAETADKDSGCLTDRYQYVTAVLVDTTDRLTPVQAAALKNLLDKTRDAVPKRGRLEIYALEPIVDQPLEPIFAGCNPGSRADVSSKLTGNPDLAERRWREQFASRVDDVLEKLIKMKPQEASPIFEAIQSIAVTALNNPKAEKAGIHQLIIASDFIQYGPKLSMYKGAPDYEKFKATQYYRDIRAKLYGVDVSLYWIPRDTKKDVQTPRFRDFWREYIRDCGGSTKDWIALQ